MTAWYDFPTTLAHNPPSEQGIDIGTPFHTPLTDVLPGTVDSASYGPWGGLVGVKTAQGEEYFLHLDEIDVAVGQALRAGDLVGLSGGQLAGGAHPAQQPYSSGPHTEFGIFSGKLFGSASIDPTGIIAGLRSGAGAGSVSTMSTTGGSGVLGLDPSDPLGLQSAGRGIAGAGQAVVDNIGIFFKKQIVALVVAIVVALILFGR